MCPDLLLWVLLLGLSGANPLDADGKEWFLRQVGHFEESFGLQIPTTVAAGAGLKYFELAEATMAKWKPSGIENGDVDVTGEG
jgi:hypothetical protein